MSSKIQHNSDIDTVSSRNSRRRILDRALDLITRRGEAGVTMADIAKASRVSRQAVYLHFADRAALMLALVRHIDETSGLGAAVERIQEAPDALQGLRELVKLQARMNPSVWAVARALDAVRRTDAAAERGWQDRLQHRLEGAQHLVARLKKEGKLRDDLDVATAADLLWSVTSLRMWEDLVLQRGWSPARYEKHITELSLAALVPAKLLASELRQH